MTRLLEVAGADGRRRPAPWVRLGLFLAFAFVMGLGVKAVGSHLERDPAPAGFLRGLVQGALMPLALPTLMVGIDVPIYAERNTGIDYKRGYTLGVSVCGAVFFGVSFARLARWRRGVSARQGGPAA